MSNNEDKRLSRSEYFDLRERRLKLVYKILYVVVAIWTVVLLSIAQNTLEKSVIPIYSFALSASSMVIIQIIKYAMMEFRCMKIIGCLSEDLMAQTEKRYDNIWMSFSLILLLCGLMLSIHYLFINLINAPVFLLIFSVCIFYLNIIAFIKFFKKSFRDTIIRILDGIGIVIGAISAYSLCAATCLITSISV